MGTDYFGQSAQSASYHPCMCKLHGEMPTQNTIAMQVKHLSDKQETTGKCDNKNNKVHSDRLEFTFLEENHKKDINVKFKHPFFSICIQMNPKKKLKYNSDVCMQYRARTSSSHHRHVNAQRTFPFYLKSEGEVEHRYSDKISKANCVIPLAPYLTIILDAWITKKKQKLEVF